MVNVKEVFNKSGLFGDALRIAEFDLNDSIMSRSERLTVSIVTAPRENTLIVLAHHEDTDCVPLNEWRVCVSDSQERAREIDASEYDKLLAKEMLVIDSTIQDYLRGIGRVHTITVGDEYVEQVY